MKKAVLLLLFFVSSFGFSQMTSQEWLSMVQNFQKSVDGVLISECPKDSDLQKFKIALINGESKISERAISSIKSLSSPLLKYGKEFATKHKLTDIDEASLIFYSSFSPDLVLVDNNPDVFAKIGGGGLTWTEVGQCALAALGADAVWAWTMGTGTSWSIAALTTTFTGFAKRFLGPIGIGIAVISFSACLYNEYQD